ncbi:MAG: hypothetical protein ACRDV3_00585 [Acidothermaceae bacterium]
MPATHATPAAGAPAEPAGGSWPLLAVTIVVAAEALGLAASAIWLIAYQLLGHRPHDPLDAWLVFAFAALAAIALAFVWRGVRRHRRWSRSPAVLTQLLAIPVGFNACGDGVWWLGVPVLICAVVGLIGLFAPSTTHAFVDG